MANNENLRPIKKGQLSKEEAKRRASNGGKKAGVVKKQKKLLKDTIEMFMKSKPTPQMIDTCAKMFGFNPNDLQDIITGGLIQKAIAGDAKAFEVLRDTIGQKPKEVVEATNTVVNVTDKKVINKVIKKLKDI